ASGREQHKPDDLNHSNRLVRTRMPGGVGGDRSDYLTAPIPIVPIRSSLVFTASKYFSRAFLCIRSILVALIRTKTHEKVDVARAGMAVTATGQK
ncbi:hypothetical protein, partial [Burkholderia ubonensis]|uniref:hypothetical protein n=1 Tax=Burkholderia ubonensis TaxID=101571 RepID=UPI001E31BD8E